MKRPARRGLVLFFIFAITGVALFSATAQEDRLSRFATAIKAFEAFVSEQMFLDRMPGLSVGFIKDDFTWARGFGYADLENKVPAKAESSYRLASVTKTVTAIAVLQLAEEEKINLDADIQTYVPYFPRKKWPVTVRQLLGHIGGISHYRDYAKEGYIKVPKNTREALAIFQGFDLVAEPGTRYNYSSYGFNLLGAAVEGASGIPYGEYIAKRIFEPLGMASSRLDNPFDLIPDRVRGYQFIKGELKNSEFVDISSRFASGGLRSTVVDLLKYARGIINGELVSQAAWKKMFSPMALRNGLFTWYGMGWDVEPWDGHFAAGHGGSQPETRTHLLIFPADRFAVAIASNLEGSNLIAYVRRLTELVLDDDIDTSAYASDMVLQSIYAALNLTFNHGMSQYQWNGPSYSQNQNEIRKAFDYFNENVSEKALRQDFETRKKKILAGVHPAFNQAFTIVGTYMATALEEEWGKDKLVTYLRQGPVAFFSDYIKLTASDSAPKRHPRFRPEFTSLMADWEKDWTRTYTDEIKNLSLTPGSDFVRIMPRLKQEFDGAGLYPDFTAALSSAAEHYLRKNNPDKAISILTAGQPLYSASPLLSASLGLAHLWKGDVQTARQFYVRAHELDSTHTAVGVERYVASGSFLARAEKPKEALELGEIALQFYPKETRLYIELSDLCVALGQKDRASDYLRKALQIDPKNENVRTKLRTLEKQRGTK
ncbi:MAG: serine hydrolase [Clostridiales bacterium]|nr:serine hydrolase [Clostridiales bacterium]